MNNALLRRIDLDEIGVDYLCSFLDAGPQLWQRLRDYVESQDGYIFTYVPADIAEIPGPQALCWSLSALRDGSVQNGWPGTEREQLQALRAAMKSDKHCAVFTYRWLTVGEAPKLQQDYHYLKHNNDLYFLVHPEHTKDESTLADLASGWNVGWRYSAVVGECVHLDITNKLTEVSDEAVTQFVESVVFFAVEAWDGEGHVFWIDREHMWILDEI